MNIPKSYDTKTKTRRCNSTTRPSPSSIIRTHFFDVAEIHAASSGHRSCSDHINDVFMATLGFCIDRKSSAATYLI